MAETNKHIQHRGSEPIRLSTLNLKFLDVSVELSYSICSLSKLESLGNITRLQAIIGITLELCKLNLLVLRPTRNINETDV